MKAGFARTDITAWEPGLTLMGWGQAWQQVHGVGLPLHARAMVLEDGQGARTAFVVADLLVITQGLTLAVAEVLARDHATLGLGLHNVVLTATHTHSGPSGYSHHFWMHLNAPGFSATVFQTLRDGFVAAIVEAAEALEPVTLSLGAGEVPREAGVAFNRSWFAYSRNHDTRAITWSRRDRGVDRRMPVVAARRSDGSLAGLVSWFGLHGTTVHSDNRLLHPDHKGLASLALEADGGVALMAQACCGDVSPNHRHDPERGHTVALHDDDHEAAAHVAQVQADVVREVVEAGGGVSLAGPVTVRTRFLDFHDAPVDPAFAFDGEPHVTSHARIGMSMAEGTAEGPGPLYPVRALHRGLTRARRVYNRARGKVSRKGRRHDPKWPLLELGVGARTKVAGLLPVDRIPALDPVVGWVRDQVRQGVAGEDPWIPHVLPIQLVRVGTLLVCAVPFEMTTVAGRRLRATLAEHGPDDIEEVVVCTYSNAYCGYLTTYEEYQVQHYEAGYTLFGPFTLGALRTAAASLVRTLDDPNAAVLQGDVPSMASEDALARAAFSDPWPVDPPPR